VTEGPYSAALKEIVREGEGERKVQVKGGRDKGLREQGQSECEKE